MQTNPPTTIDAYIAQFPEDIQQILQRVRAVIHAAVPQATEKISYAMPTFFLGGNLIHFAAFKQHIGVYPAGSELGALKDEVARYRTSKGTLQFPLSEPIPYELIGRVALARAAERTEKKKK
ncbi:MAG: hypothetical protein GYA20_00815 [Chloroflexi bacterium]|nr:hypothetical protein [Chloroflexota bacterium]